jgi:hypothetical protein
VVGANLRAERGDMNALKGLRIGADDEPDAALKQLLLASGLDAERDKVQTVQYVRCNLLAPNSTGSAVRGDSTVVIVRTDLLLRKKLFLFHPAMRLLEHLARIRLEYQTLPRPECADIDHVMVFFRQFF